MLKLLNLLLKLLTVIGYNMYYRELNMVMIVAGSCFVESVNFVSTVYLVVHLSKSCPTYPLPGIDRGLVRG